MAWADVTALSKHPALNVVAACDVDLNRTKQFREKSSLPLGSIITRAGF